MLNTEGLVFFRILLLLWLVLVIKSLGYSYSPLLWPLSYYSPDDIVAKMNEVLSLGKVENENKLRVHDGYISWSRVGLVRKSLVELMHGYEDEFFSMIMNYFIGHGPQFARGKKIHSFENIEIYNLMNASTLL